MKTALALGAISALTLAPVFGQQAANHGDPFTPVGWLTVNRVHVRTGVKPELTWSIQYPKTVHDIVDIDPETDKIVPKQK
ncbi:MAG: hypothetical protein HKO57_07225, partial [Akkermansiaceae bacterium]|nr:hypothetical protein [Akkermansiaceae bacterium]